MNNEKIMQLAHQVGFNGTLTHTQAGTKHDTALADFAKLIVKECIDVVEGSPWNLPKGYKAVDQAKLLKNHFGVE
jgi:hypothetical protein